MTQTVRKIRKSIYESKLPVKKYKGQNSWMDHNALSPDESRSISNYDIFQDDAKGDNLKSRYGSNYLNPVSSPAKYTSGAVTNAIEWDVGADTYLITQIGTAFYSQKLTTIANPVLIALLHGGSFVVGSSTQADMFLDGDRIYVFHPSGNKIIEWDNSSAFTGRPMGLSKPYLTNISWGSGVITGRYTIGIELVYQINGADRLTSSPNRKLIDFRVSDSGTRLNNTLVLAIQATELDADTTWTHLRVWRSKNQNVDYTDPLNPIDAQGIPSELYEEALITKAEISLGSLTAIATGGTLPVGNTGTKAGGPAGNYVVELNSLDNVFSVLIGIDDMELLPMPKAACGCKHGNRIFVSGVADTTLSDYSKANIWYSSATNTKYGELYNPLNFIDTGKDGQNMIRLFSFEGDLIGIKEGKTGRLAHGNVNNPFSIINHKIGISHLNAATFIPSIGICAITTDFGDFRIFGLDYRWTNILNGLDISLPIRLEMQALTLSSISIFYANGKIMVSAGNATFYVLHEKENRGWTTYSFPMNTLAHRAFVFANHSRVAVVTGGAYLVEIELSAYTTDVNTATDAAQNITCLETTHQFQSDEGRDIVEMEFLSVQASLTDTLSAIPYMNGAPWPLLSSTTSTAFTPDPGVHQGNTTLKDREYRLFLEPATVGRVAWQRYFGNYLHFTLSTIAPCSLGGKILNAIVDQDGMAGGQFDPFQTLVFSDLDPTFEGDKSVLILNFDADSATQDDSSGNARTHTFTSTSGSRVHVAMAPGYAESAIYADGRWSNPDLIGISELGISGSNVFANGITWNSVFKLKSLSAEANIAQASDGTRMWQISIKTDGTIEFRTTAGGGKKYSSASGAVVVDTKYIMSLILAEVAGAIDSITLYLSSGTTFSAITLTTASNSLALSSTVHKVMESSYFEMTQYEIKNRAITAAEAETYFNRIMDAV